MNTSLGTSVGLLTTCKLLVANALLGVLLARTVAGQTASTRSQVINHYHRAEAALARGDTNIAVAEFKAILAIEPSNVPGLG